MTKRFGEFTALDHVSLKVPAGTFHALLGENGAGKSTLVKCIMGYYQPDQGGILVDGRDRRSTTRATAHALGIGMVYQHFTLVPTMTVAENLVLARRSFRRWSTGGARRRSSSLPRAHAVPRAARRQGLGDFRRREAEAARSSSSSICSAASSSSTSRPRC